MILIQIFEYQNVYVYCKVIECFDFDILLVGWQFERIKFGVFMYYCYSIIGIDF